MQKVLILTLVLFLVLLLVLLFGVFQKKKQGQVCFNDYCFEVEIAQNLAQRTKGLMFREKLEENQGMLFVFSSEKQHSFWMKNVSFPLDILWLNSNQEVVFISHNSQPCVGLKCLAIKPNQKAQYVLEIKGGLADKIGIKEGSKLIFSENII